MRTRPKSMAPIRRISYAIFPVIRFPPGPFLSSRGFPRFIRGGAVFRQIILCSHSKKIRYGFDSLLLFKMIGEIA